MTFVRERLPFSRLRVLLVRRSFVFVFSRNNRASPFIFRWDSLGLAFGPSSVFLLFCFDVACDRVSYSERITDNRSHKFRAPCLPGAAVSGNHRAGAMTTTLGATRRRDTPAARTQSRCSTATEVDSAAMTPGGHWTSRTSTTTCMHFNGAVHRRAVGRGPIEWMRYEGDPGLELAGDETLVVAAECVDRALEDGVDVVATGSTTRPPCGLRHPTPTRTQAVTPMATPRVKREHGAGIVSMLVRVHESRMKPNHRGQRHAEVPDPHYASQPLGLLRRTRRRPVRFGGWTMAE